MSPGWTGQFDPLVHMVARRMLRLVWTRGYSTGRSSSIFIIMSNKVQFLYISWHKRPIVLLTGVSLWVQASRSNVLVTRCRSFTRLGRNEYVARVRRAKPLRYCLLIVRTMQHRRECENVKLQQLSQGRRKVVRSWSQVSWCVRVSLSDQGVMGRLNHCNSQWWHRPLNKPYACSNGVRDGSWQLVRVGQNQIRKKLPRYLFELVWWLTGRNGTCVPLCATLKVSNLKTSLTYIDISTALIYHREHLLSYHDRYYPTTLLDSEL